MTDKRPGGIPKFISEKRAEIEALCRQYHVTRLEIFGSAVTGEFDSNTSDLDFLMEFESGLDPNLKLDAYLEFNQGLERLFGRRVDLVFFRAVKNPYVRCAMERKTTTLYAA
jgi:predicted nucleotidyltransferase